MALLVRMEKSHAQHIALIHASLRREVIIPIGTTVAVRNALGYTRIGKIVSYGFSRMLDLELRGVKVYAVRGNDTTELGVGEFEADEIMVLGE